MNYLVLHATHGTGLWALIYEGNQVEVQAYLLKDRFCPPEHYRIVSVKWECSVGELSPEYPRFEVRTGR